MSQQVQQEAGRSLSGSQGLSTSSSPTATSAYERTLSRIDELDALESAVGHHKAALLYGAEGIGKSRLLRVFAGRNPHRIYTAETQSPHELLSGLAEQLNAHSMLPTRRLKSWTTLGLSSQKGIIQSVLDSRPCMLILDQVVGPSNALSRLIKDLHYLGRTPIVISARSPHMEDIGTLSPVVAQKSQQIHMTEWSNEMAFAFAREQASHVDLRADGINELLERIVHFARGNPGAISAMIKMATFPRYRMENAVKVNVLYLDFRMGRSSLK